MLCVSHDRWFINRTATRILDLTGRTLIEYKGNYDYYLEKHEELTSRLLSPGAATHSSGGAISSTNTTHLSMQHVPSENSDSEGRQDWKKQKEEQARERKRTAKLKEVEDNIASLEERDHQIDEDLAKEEVYTDLQQVTALSSEKAQIAQQLEELYDLWAELEE